MFDEIARRLPLTLELAMMGLLLSLVIAIPVGVISALKQNSWVDYLFRSFSNMGLAIPGFWLATMLILFLTVFFQWTPPLGYAGLTQDPWKNIQQLFLPAIVIARMTRSAMLEVLREDYVRTTWARGLSLRSILSVHAQRNAMLPILTLAAIELGHLLSGTVVMETIFTLPGIGRYLIDAIFHRDYPVVREIILLMGVLFVTLNSLVDILYGVLDPRIRYS